MLVLFAVTHALSSNPLWISGSESAQSHFALFRLGSTGAFAVILSVPRSVPIADFCTCTAAPFQVTRLTEEGATTSSVVVAFKSPCSARTLPPLASVALRTRYGPNTSTEGTSGARSYIVAFGLGRWVFQKDSAVCLSATNTLAFPRVTVVMPEGVPVMMRVPLEPRRAETEEEPVTLGDPEEAPKTTASMAWPAFAYRTKLSMPSIVVHANT